MKKVAIAIVLLAVLYGGIWLFNHINGWVGIAVIIIGLYAVVKFIVSLIKNYNKDEEK